MAIVASAQKRLLSTIAEEIEEVWPNVHDWARPYLDAMHQLGMIDGKFYEDSAEEVVIRFLSNASMWRGEHARRIKAELKAMIGQKK